MLGHASAAMTLDTYADLFPDDLDTVSQRLNQVRTNSLVGFLWGKDSQTTKKPRKHWVYEAFTSVASEGFEPPIMWRKTQ